ncbi:MAG: hypothetical protein NWF13_08860 [Candidatus Bathyarchaeota archaeon]|nr:hypothetical protein [Candidatus Bathyarchaeota archaeon]
MSGVITLGLAIVGGPWWVTVGGAGGEAFHASISPFVFDVSILGNALDIPVIYWLNVAARIAFILAGLEITVASFLVQKAWSKSFISLRALWTSLLFIISIYIGLAAVHNILGIAIPLYGEALLTYALPIQSFPITAEVPTQTYFTTTFELALVSGVLAIVARMIHGRLTPAEVMPPTEVVNSPVS